MRSLTPLEYELLTDTIDVEDCDDACLDVADYPPDVEALFDRLLSEGRVTYKQCAVSLRDQHPIITPVGREAMRIFETLTRVSS